MLVLTRKKGESIIIGDNIRLEVAEIDLWDGKVRIGITAPKDVPVHRSEVLERIHREGERKPPKVS